MPGGPALPGIQKRGYPVLRSRVAFLAALVLGATMCPSRDALAKKKK